MRNILLLLLHLLMEPLLHVVANLLLLSGIGALEHAPERMLEQIIHGLNTAALHLRQAEEHKYRTDVGHNGKEKEGAVTHCPQHVGRSRGNAVVYDPVREETARHAERSDTSREDFSTRHSVRKIVMS